MRVQLGLVKEPLDGGIAHVWLAFSSPNGAPLEFHNLGVEGWVQRFFERSAPNHFEEWTKTSTCMVFEAAGCQAPPHKGLCMKRRSPKPVQALSSGG